MAHLPQTPVQGSGTRHPPLNLARWEKDPPPPVELTHGLRPGNLSGSGSLGMSPGESLSSAKLSYIPRLGEFTALDPCSGLPASKVFSAGTPCDCKAMGVRVLWKEAWCGSLVLPSSCCVTLGNVLLSESSSPVVNWSYLHLLH